MEAGEINYSPNVCSIRINQDHIARITNNNNNNNNFLFVLYRIKLLFLNHTYLGWQVAAYNIENKNIEIF